MNPTAMADAAPTRRGSRGMNIALWAVQILLAFVFSMAGGTKLFRPLDEVAKNMAWVSAVPAGLVRFIGACELAGALGLILPAATRVQPRLTPLAAIGLATVVLLGSILHFTRGEGNITPVNFALAALALFVAWGRTKKALITPRS